MECTITSLKDVSKDNPTLCLSPLRALNRCFECTQFQFQNALKNNKDDISQTLFKMRCNPRVPKEVLKEKQKLLSEKRKLLDRLSKINKELE